VNYAIILWDISKSYFDKLLMYPTVFGDVSHFSQLIDALFAKMGYLLISSLTGTQVQVAMIRINFQEIKFL
jgi:hypothetical protein